MFFIVKPGIQWSWTRKNVHIQGSTYFWNRVSKYECQPIMSFSTIRKEKMLQHWKESVFPNIIFLKMDDKMYGLISLLFILPLPPQVCVSEMRAVDLGQLSKVHVEHHNVGYGAGWYLDQIVIHESGKTDGQYAFLCQQWLDSGVGDAQTERTLKLLGKVRNGMLTGKIYGKNQNHQSSFQLLF